MALPGNLGRTTQCNVNLILSSCFLKNNSFQGLGGCSGRCPGTSRNILTAQKTKLSAITGQLLVRVLQGHSGWGKPSHRPGPRSASTAVPPPFSFGHCRISVHLLFPIVPLTLPATLKVGHCQGLRAGARTQQLVQRGSCGCQGEQPGRARVHDSFPGRI